MPQTQFRVLLIEDDDVDARAVSRMLRSAPSTLERDSRLSAACDRLKDARFDVILLDLGLPDAIGLEALDTILKSKPDCPIIVLTGMSDEDAAIEAVEKGAQDYLVKSDLTPGFLTKSIRYAIARHRLEAELLQAKNLEAIGHLAGGIAHDFNNQLTAILGFASFALESAQDERTRASLQQIVHAAEKSATLTRQLLAVGRKQVMVPSVVDLNELLSSCELLLSSVIGENTQLVMHLHPHLGRVHADPTQFDRVVLNLVMNAADAMSSGGTLTIETSNVELDQHYATNHPGAAAGPHVLLSVSDTGTGMDQATLSRVFEPFFTTKPFGDGSGLGLATVHGIVKQSSGYVWVHSEPGRGTTFKIYLPRIHDESSAPMVADSSALTDASPTTIEVCPATILLVEDDQQIRELVTSVLRAKGFDVIAAPDGPTALQECEQFEGRIDLLLTDVVMPQMDGRELATHLKASHPEARVIFMSGYSEDVIASHGILD